MRLLRSKRRAQRVPRSETPPAQLHKDNTPSGPSVRNNLHPALLQPSQRGLRVRFPLCLREHRARDQEPTPVALAEGVHTLDGGEVGVAMLSRTNFASLAGNALRQLGIGGRILPLSCVL